MDFKNCKTVQELNEARLNMLGEINREYTKRKEELLKSAPEYRRVAIIATNSIEDPKVSPSMAIPVDIKRHANPNQIVIEGSIVII